MTGRSRPSTSRRLRAVLAGALLLAAPGAVRASDHLDSSAVIADPRIDIGDIYAWMSPDARRLNLVMTIVGHSFSDQATYVFHVDSGPHYGATGASTTITCRFRAMNAADCRVGEADRAAGDASGTDGLASRGGRFRLFAGLRDDPFFNNVRGSRAAYNVAAAAVKDGVPFDAAGCPAFAAATSAAILQQWRMTDGGPARDFLAGWTPASIVLSLDIGLVNRGGPVLAVWGATLKGTQQIDRMGRPLTGNALLATLGTADESDRMKLQYNAATPSTAASFVPAVEQGLGLYDGFDGRCGDQLLAAPGEAAAGRYRRLAELLVDDRLWINSASGDCSQLFAVERAALTGDESLRRDCGGRRLNADAIDAYRSFLVNGTAVGVDDGVDRDAADHSETVFPFLAPPPPPPPPAG